MYNKLKRAFGLTSAILTIVIGSIEALGGFISFIAGVVLLFSNIGLGDLVGLGTAIGTMLGALIDLGLGIVLILIGAKCCRQPVKVDGVYDNKKKMHITLIVLLGILAFFGVIGFFINSIAGKVAGLGVLTFLMVLTALGFEIANLFLKDEVDAPVDYTNAPWPMDSVFPDMQPQQTEVETASAPVAEETPVETSATEEQVEQIAVELPAVEEKVEETPAATEVRVEAPLTIEEKLAELKRLKEIGALSEEQYNAAVAQLISNLTK